MGKANSKKPLLEALINHNKQRQQPWHIPAHKGLGKNWLNPIEGKTLALDKTELLGLDDLHDPHGVIAAAQREMAGLCGCQQAYFLVNGASVGLQAAILASTKPGDKVLVPRNAHKSIWAGLALAQAEPVWLPVTYDPVWQIPLGITEESLAQAIAANPTAKTAIFVHPTYHGLAGQINNLVNMAKKANITTIVDESHGAHFAFMGDPPPAAFSQPSIIVQGWHKTMGSLTQSAVLLQNDQTLPIQAALNMLQSSSPSYLLMASLDATRAYWQDEGKELGQKLLVLSQFAEAKLSQIDGLICLTKKDFPPPVVAKDQTRLLLASQTGTKGWVLAEALAKEGVIAEMADNYIVTMVLSLADSQKSIEALAKSCQRVVKKLPAGSPIAKQQLQSLPWSLPVVKILPAQTRAYELAAIPINEAAGKIAGGIIAPYPPGIPLLAPGELITPYILEILKNIIKGGGKVQGLVGPKRDFLPTLKI